MAEKKVCSRCNKPKALTGFGVLARAKDGRKSRCLSCDAELAKERRAAKGRRTEPQVSPASVTHIDTRRRASRRSKPKAAGSAGHARDADHATPSQSRARVARRGAKGENGQPTKLTPDVQTAVCYAIQTGCYYETAAQLGGIDKTTFWRWMRAGEKAETGEFRDFYQAVLAAEADAEVRAVELWRSGMADNWQAARDFLARRHPERWGPMERTVGAGSGREDYEEPVDDPAVVDSAVEFVARLAESRRGRTGGGP